MTATATTFNSDFVTFSGDAPSPIFTVLNSAGVAVDISGVTEISWYCQAYDAVAAALTLTKTGGAIAFVGTGTDGRFQVNLTAVQTALLDGQYKHLAAITLGGKVLTVEAGRMLVNASIWTYNQALAATVPLFYVRRLIGDVLVSDQQLMDNEILAALTEKGGNKYAAAAECCRFIAGQFSRKPENTSTVGGQSTSYGDQAKRYLTMAAEFEKQAKLTPAGTFAYAGGISIADKRTNQQDTDRVNPNFNLGMDDNMLPVPVGGNLQPTAPMGNGTTP